MNFQERVLCLSLTATSSRPPWSSLNRHKHSQSGICSVPSSGSVTCCYAAETLTCTHLPLLPNEKSTDLTNIIPENSRVKDAAKCSAIVSDPVKIVTLQYAGTPEHSQGE